MRRTLRWMASGGLVGGVAAGVCVSVAVLVVFGWRATQEWRRSEELLANRRAHEAVDRFVNAIGRDMRGVQESILSSWWEEFTFDPPDDVRSTVASAFAKYPYPESFFAWRRLSTVDAVPFFNRPDRHPAWMTPDDSQLRYPVSIGHDGPAARALFDRIHADVRQGRRFSIFEMTLGGARYQVVARLFYRDPFREQIDTIVGFTVNLSWVREHYFPEFARQVSRIGDGRPLAISDQRGETVWGVSPPRAASGPVVRRSFPVMFFDPILAGLDSPPDLSHELWSVEAGTDTDEALKAAISGANRTLVIAAIATVVLALGMLLMARASLASAKLSGMRSEFVSTVTHELKTPIATIRAIGDTLARGRITDPRALQEYAQMVVQEAKRLTRLIENLLAYARITDVTEVYAFEPIDLRELVEETLQRFRAQLADTKTELHADLPPDLPLVRGDRTALGLVLDNIIDNAIRYSVSRRWLQVQARHDGVRRVVLDVGDHGVGIPAEELGQVTRRFFRGRHAPSSGSGLGLAIVSRIVEDHGGTMTIQSTIDEATTVSIAIPVAGSES